MPNPFSRKPKKPPKQHHYYKDDTEPQAGPSAGPENGETRPAEVSGPTVEAPKTSLHKIVIGVDFGTTYTGVSYVSTAGNHVKGLGDIKVVQNWPGPVRDADLAWKTPSRIAYASENPTLVKNNWGFEVSAKHRAFAWMKLLLDPEQSTRYDDPSLAASEGQGVLRLPEGRTAVDVCADFLEEVAKFAFEELKKEFGEDVVAVSPLEFWFTVPSVWSDRAKADTLRAAERAAKNAKVFKTLETSTFLIQEPEAAAVATISDIARGGSILQIKPGDSVLVCDCGGGTVDITAYQVVSIEPKLGFKELLVGTGGKCGSTYIDRLFIRWMRETFGVAYTRLGWKKRGPGSPLMKAFEGHKKDFGTAPTSVTFYEMPLVMQGVQQSRYYDPDEAEVKIYHGEMKQFFEPVINKIIKLIESQLDAENSIKTIILVGGFGDSRYLYDTLQKRFKERGVRLICPKHPQAAIVRGAALSGLHRLQPSSRRARRYYGFSWGVPFSATDHRPEHRYWDTWDSSWRARGYIKWSLSKGDVVTETTFISHSVCRTPEDSEITLKFAIPVYCCDLDAAPPHRDDPGVRKLVALDVDLTSFDLSQCERKQVQGRTFVKVDYELRVYFGSKRGVLNFLCIYNGKAAGSVSIQFDGQGSEGANGTHGSGDEQNAESCSVM